MPMKPLSSLAVLWRRPGMNGRILRAALAVSAAGLVVKLLATLKECVVAGLYGRSDAMDAFLVAALLPNLLINLIAESMNQALIPTLVRVEEQQGHAHAQRLLDGALFWLCLLLAAASLLMALAAPFCFPLLGWGFPVAKLALARRLFYALLPLVLLSGVATNCTAVLNTRDRFALPALAPLAIPATVLLFALCGVHRWGIWALVWGSVLGALLHAGFVAALLGRHGYRFRLVPAAADEATREVARQYGPVLLSSLVASGGLLVDQAMAATFPAGSVAALVYANRFVAVVLTLMAGAISTAIVPDCSRLVARRDWAGCGRLLLTWRRLTAAASVPIAAALIFGAHPLIRLSFERGAFHAADTAAVAPVLVMYALQIPFFVVSRVDYRFLVAMRRTDLIFYCGAINLLLDVVLNLVLMHFFAVAGIALATSLWTVGTCLFLRFWARRLLADAVASDVGLATDGSDEKG